MSHNLLEFTKSISGVDLTEYIINYIDQNMIMYKLLQNVDFNISMSKENDNTVRYTLTDLSYIDKEMILSYIKKSIQLSPGLKIYGIDYYIDIPECDNNDFVITIQQCD